jgi:hypothetical protein
MTTSGGTCVESASPARPAPRGVPETPPRERFTQLRRASPRGRSCPLSVVLIRWQPYPRVEVAFVPILATLKGERAVQRVKGAIRTRAVITDAEAEN